MVLYTVFVELPTKPVTLPLHLRFERANPLPFGVVSAKASHEMESLAEYNLR